MEPSRDHPTPYPAKFRQRRSTRSSMKEQENQASNELNGAVVVTPGRQKRVLSLSKSVNTLDLSVNDKPSRPGRRLSVPSKYATPVSKIENREVVPTISENKSTTSKSSPLNAGKSLGFEDKAKATTKMLSVSFQGSSLKSLGKADGANKDTSSSSTPPAPSRSSISTVLLDNSNCGQRRKFNTLRSSSYWLTQIKLSESAGMHAISLGFFRLALQSTAEPFQRLCNEIKAYARKHNVLALEPDARDVLLSYGVLDEVMPSEIDEQLAVMEDTEKGSLVESEGFVVRINELCTPISENEEEKSSGVNNEESATTVKDECQLVLDTSKLEGLPASKDILHSFSEESEVYTSKNMGGEVASGDDNMQEMVEVVRSKTQNLPNKANLVEEEGNVCRKFNNNVRKSVSKQKNCTVKDDLFATDKTEYVAVTTGGGSIPDKKKVIQKTIKSLTAAGLKSQMCVVKKSLDIESAEKVSVANMSRCPSRRSCAIVATKNEPHGTKNYSQQDKKGLPSSAANVIEQHNETLDSQQVDQLNKHEGSKGLSKGTDFDLQSMSVDTLMDEVVSCIMSSMDDCTDPGEQVSLKSLEDKNAHNSYATDDVATEKITLKEGLTMSVLDSIGGIVHENHIDAMGSSICNEEPLKDSAGVASSDDGYSEEVGDNAYSLIEEREERHSDKDTLQMDRAELEVCEDNIMVCQAESELKDLKCGFQGSEKFPASAGLRKDQEVVAILDKENTINESCRVPITKGRSKHSFGKEVKGQTKISEDCKITSQNSATVGHSSRWRGRRIY